MPIDVLLTNDAARLAGGERCVLTLAGELSRRGHRVRLAPAEGSELAAAARAAGLGVLPVRYGRALRQFAAARALATAVAADPPDLIHTHSESDRSAGALVARRLGARCVTSVHSCQSVQHNPFHWWRNRALIQRFLPVSHTGARLLRERDRLGDRVVAIPNGIDPARVTTPPGTRDRRRAELGVGPGQALCLSVGRLARFKGHDVLLRAVPAIRAAAPDTRFVIAGEGEERTVLAAQIARDELAGTVTLLGERADVAALLAAADIVVQPSREGGGESCPMVVIEALAAGRPLVASAVAEIPFLVDDGRAGLLVPPEQPDPLAAAVLRLVHDAAARRRLGEAARAHFAAHYTAAVMADAVLGVYEEVLGGRRAADAG